MNRKVFQKNLEALLPSVLSYAVDEIPKLKKVLETRHQQDSTSSEFKTFINKCHEGFKKAQTQIIPILLVLEDEIIIVKQQIFACERGKHKKELERDEIHNRLSDELFELEIQRRAIKNVADVIVWNIFHLEKTHIKAFMTPSMHSGYLKDRDIKSVKKIAEEYNRDENSFALITDITSTIGIGDILLIKGGEFHVIEVGGGEKNDKVENTLHEVFGSGLDKADINKWRDLMRDSDFHEKKHLYRKTKQLLRSMAAVHYLQFDEGYDPTLKAYKKATTIEAPSQSFSEIINLALDQEDKWSKYPFLLPLDCVIVGIVKRNTPASYLTSEWEFKHHLYHFIYEPWENCGYGKLQESNKESDESFFEFPKYYNIPIFRLLQAVFYPVVLPLYITLKPQHAISLYCRIMSIFMFFDGDRFIDMCHERGLDAEWNEYPNQLKGGNTRDLAKFDKGYIQISYEGTTIFLGNGILFRMLYEFQSGYSTIEQIKEMLITTTEQHMRKEK
ncbi:MAG: hypothetical protein V1907_01675 [Candidatus Kerfeldbacteria bacterium]